MKNTCQFCKYWGHEDEKNDDLAPSSVDARLCELSPFDSREMENNQCAVSVGWDGSVWFGKDFGCIHFEAMEDLQ